MDIVFTCKHCNENFIVNKNDFNCKILRHGVIKNTLLPINPHESKENCDMLFNNNLIFGCGKPLIIVQKNNNDYDVEICEYI
jgi:hypothetical protein